MIREINLIEFASNRELPTIIVGSHALACHGLVSGYNCSIISTPYYYMDNVQLGDIIFEYYHVQGDKYLTKHNGCLYLPTVERALIDTMIWYKENGTEGFLIEALQTYQDQGHKVEELYECAEYYKVPREVVDYWWSEAEEESDMSMG